MNYPISAIVGDLSPTPH